jgi:TP901 family phage tail tape measure protein
MAKTSKLELIMELSDRLFNNKLSQVQAKLGAATDKMDAKLTKLSGGHVKMAAGVGAAFAAIGGLAAVTATIDRSIDSAVKFNTAFLPIRQLNLDKSKAEMDSYRSMIRESAYEVGTSLDVSTKAYYDLQSATGLYGKEAEAVFKMVGNYSIATGANLGDAMNSTTKSMKAYGLGVQDIDALLTSNAKTVQVGITTFDELARVQTDYAGSVSAAGQNFDTGNKVFAMFTSIAKSADIAANMTKTFFDGLGQQSQEIKDNLGIDVFDAKGNMKDADKILFEITSKFKNLNEKQITNIINKIGGPEGLRTGLAKVKTGADDMIATFNNFDSSKFSMADALKNAQADYGKMKEMFNNRLDIIFSKIGEKLIPQLSKMLDVLTPALDWLSSNLDWLIPVIVNVSGALALLTAGVWLFNIATAANPIGLIIIGIAAFIGLATIAIVKFDEWGATLLFLLGPIGRLIAAFKLLYDHWESIKTAFKDDGIIGGLKRIGTVLLDVILKPMQQFFEMIGMDSIAGKIEELRSGMDLVTDGENDKRQALSTDVLDPNNFMKATAWNTNPTALANSLIKSPVGSGGIPKGKDKKNSDNVNKVAGAANQVRNVTIQIDAFNKGGINVSKSAYSGMTKDDVEAWFKEMMRRTIINAETV